MQTLHLRFRALRAISLRQGLSRWRTPSGAKRAGMGGVFALPNPPEPTCAVGSRPATRHPSGILCPVTGAGLPGVPRLRAARTDSRGPVLPCRVCRWQTACDPVSHPAPHEAGDGMPDHRQARASESRWLASDGLSFPLRPQPYGGRASGEKTVAQSCGGLGSLISKTTVLRPTGRTKPFPKGTGSGWASSPLCTNTSALVTSQELGTLPRRQLSALREEGGWPATTSL